MIVTPPEARRVPSAPRRRPPTYLTEDVLLDRLTEAQKHLRLDPKVWAVLVDVICPDEEDGDPTEHPLPAAPTQTLPGTEARIKVLIERARRKERLFHPDDLTFDRDAAADRMGVLVETLGNGSEARLRGSVVRQEAAGQVLAGEEMQPAAAVSVTELRARVRSAIAGTGDLDELAVLLEGRPGVIPDLATRLGIDIRKLRRGGGTFLRAFLTWVRRERKRAGRDRRNAADGKTE